MTAEEVNENLTSDHEDRSSDPEGFQDDCDPKPSKDLNSTDSQNVDSDKEQITKEEDRDRSELFLSKKDNRHEINVPTLQEERYKNKSAENIIESISLHPDSKLKGHPENDITHFGKEKIEQEEDPLIQSKYLSKAQEDQEVSVSGLTDCHLPLDLGTGQEDQGEKAAFPPNKTQSVTEEAESPSTAPHMTWARNVVKELLGSFKNKESEPLENLDANPEEEVMPIYATIQRHPGCRQDKEGVVDEESLGIPLLHPLETPDRTARVETPSHRDRDAIETNKRTDPLMEKSDIGIGEYTLGTEREPLETETKLKANPSTSKTCPSHTLICRSNSCPSPSQSPSSEKPQPTTQDDTDDRTSNLGRRVEGGQEDRKAEERVQDSFQDKAHFRRKGFRKTTERKKEEDEDEEGGRDRRTRIFNVSDEDDDLSVSLTEVELRHVTEVFERKKRNSKYLNTSQLYQQYSEGVQNREILRQCHSDTLSLCEEIPPASASPSPNRSLSAACRPLPELPPVPHPHSFSISARSLPLPPVPKVQPSSPRISISFNQSPTLWQDLPGVRNSLELGDLTDDQRRLQEIRFEVITSEASYCKSLDIVVEHFVKSKTLGKLLKTQDRNWLFSRLGDVRAVSHSFLTKLEERVENNTMNFTVCDIITGYCPRFRKVYVPYLTNQSYQDKTYQRLMDENPGFRHVVENLERSPVCQRLPLRSFLILPFQRITRLKLLVQNIVKRTTPKTEEETDAIKAMKLLEKMIQESNDSITQMKSIESLVSLSAKVDFECRTLPLVSQSRRLVREGSVTELMDVPSKEEERRLYLHLFNDYLLVSLGKDGGRFTVIDHAPVADLRVENCRAKLHSRQKSVFRLYLNRKSLLLRTDTESDKLRWISALSNKKPEINYSAEQGNNQMQCIRAFVAQQPDELTLDKADVLLVHQQSSDGWVEGTKLSDGHQGWAPESHLEAIVSKRAREQNLEDTYKITMATAAN